MSVELYPSGELSGNNGSLQDIAVGGTKPLHRFLKGQPKIMGTVVLVMGASLIIFSIAVTSSYIWATVPPGFILGTLFIISGILYILTELNPTKKKVTISFALSIVSILLACWALLNILANMHRHMVHHYDDNITDIEIVWSSYAETMAVSIEAVVLFHSCAGAIIFIVMSALAGAALRSTRSQAIVVMNTTSTVKPAE